MARAPFESDMATSVGKRGPSVKNLVFIGVVNLLGWMQILYSLESRRTVLNDVHPVAGDILLYLSKGCSHSFLFGLERRAPFAGRESALAVDTRVTCGASDDNDATTAVCIAMCCFTPSVDSFAVAIPVLLQCLHGCYVVRYSVSRFMSG